MPIRSIKDPKYRGVSELYRKSDGEVTGYYITYRDREGRPVKKRVEARDRDEALAILQQVKAKIDKEKKGEEMSVAPIGEPVVPEMKKDKGATPSDVVKKVTQKREKEEIGDYRREISSWSGEGVVLFLEIAAFEDLAICYGYERSEAIARELGLLLRRRLENMGEDDGIRGVWRLYDLPDGRFVLHIRRVLPPREIDLIAEELIRSVATRAFGGDPELPIHLNLCVGATRGEGEKGLLYALKALREARRSRSRYLYYDAGSIGEEERFSELLFETLVRNISESGVEPYFQGIYAASEDARVEPRRYESLMRIMDAAGLPLAPGVFMERSREYGLYTRLMRQMIDKVVRHLEEREELALSINLSYRDFTNPELFGHLEAELRRTGVGERLTVEILESEVIEDFDLLRERILRLRRLGVGVAIDDFGSGFANFDTMAELEVDFVKIDGGLIAKIHEPRYRAILENMVAICRELGIRTVAEFVSDEATRRAVCEIGVDYLQGYHLHRPEPWEKIDRKERGDD